MSATKLWALKDETQRTRFVIFAFLIGLTLPCMAFGGILGRAVLGDDLIGTAANDVVPRLFIELLPVWLAAFLGVGILAAVMSTADGVVITMSQIFANDIYRLTYAPKYEASWSAAEIDRKVLKIGRIATVVILLASAAVAWLGQGLNITLLGAIGFGGMSSAFAGPLILGILWPRVDESRRLRWVFRRWYFVYIRGRRVCDDNRLTGLGHLCCDGIPRTGTPATHFRSLQSAFWSASW